MGASVDCNNPCELVALAQHLSIARDLIVVRVSPVWNECDLLPGYSLSHKILTSPLCEDYDLCCSSIEILFKPSERPIEQGSLGHRAHLHEYPRPDVPDL